MVKNMLSKIFSIGKTSKHMAITVSSKVKWNLNGEGKKR